MDTSKPSGLTFSSAPQLPQELPAPHWQSLHCQSLLCLYICSFDRWAGRQRPHWAEVKLTSSSVAILILFDFLFPFLVVAIVSEAPCGRCRHCALPPQHVRTFWWLQNSYFFSWRTPQQTSRADGGGSDLNLGHPQNPPIHRPSWQLPSPLLELIH